MRGSRRRPGAITAPQVGSLSVTQTRVGVAVSVTITGENFRNCPLGTPPQVTFGGVAATDVVVVDQHTITCTCPAGTAPGVVDVVVTVGCC